MVHLLRRYQQSLMILITIFVIISIVAFYNSSRFMDRDAANRMGFIYGNPVTIPQAQKMLRKLDLIEGGMDVLGLRDMLISLAITKKEAKENFIWNSLVLKHEADYLGIRVTDDEVFTTIQAMPLFQTKGVYDSSLFNGFVAAQLGQRGLTISDLEDIVRDDLRIKKIKKILSASAPATEAEIRAAFTQMFQKLDASLIRLKIEDFLPGVQITNEDLKKSFDQRKGTLKSDELRKVKYVVFILPTTDKPLAGPDREQELLKLQKAAGDFSVAMTEKDNKFEDVAAKANAKVEVTPDFAESKPPAELSGSSEAATAAFKLSNEQPNSDAVKTDRGYYVLQLSSITPARPLTFEEAKGKLTEEMKRERAQEAMNQKASEIKNKLDAETKAGKSLAEATQAAGVKAEAFPPFSSEDAMNGHFSEMPDSSAVMQTARLLNDGETSPFLPDEKGGILVRVEKHEPIDDAKFKAERARLAEQVSEIKRGALFEEWIKHRKVSAMGKEGPV